MNKTEIKQCINETIVPNNEHGITAESLNLILNEMVDNSGESGSGVGALRVIVPDLELGSYFIEEGCFNQENLTLLRESVAAEGAEELVAPLFNAYEAAFTHNAKIFAAIMEKSKKGEGCVVLLDQSPIGMALIESEKNMGIGNMIEEFGVSVSQVANIKSMYINYAPDVEADFGGDQTALVLHPTISLPDSFGYNTYPTNIMLLVMQDGSIYFDTTSEEQPSSGSGVVTFYFDPTTGGFTEEKKAKNAESYASFFDMGGECSVILKNFALPETILTSPCVTMGVAEDGLLALMVLDTDVTNPTGGFSKITYMVSSDGSITVQQ